MARRSRAIKNLYNNDLKTFLMSISHKRSPFSNIPLRWVLTVPVVVQIVGAVGLVGYLSYRSGQSAIENMVNQVSDQATSRVRDHLANSLQNQHQAVAISQRYIQNGALDINDLDRLRQHFWQQISLSPSLGAIYFANEQGEMTGYGRLLSQDAVEQTKKLTGQELALGETVLLETTPQDRTHRQYYVIDNQGKAKKLYGNLPINNRNTVWYRAGKAATAQTWSPIYVFQDAPTLGINTVAPIKDVDGNFQGVLSTSIRLTAISTFLNHLDFAPSGQAFIIDRAGELVATSTLERPYKQDVNGKPSRLSASQSQDLRTKLVTTQLQQQYGDLQQIQSKQRLEVPTDGNTLFVQVEPYQDNFGLNWLLVTVIPESDFMGEIRANAQWTAWLCVLTLIAITGLSILTTRWITHPIFRLSQASKAMAIGNWQEPLPEDQAIAELQTLSVSFNGMANQVRQSFDRVETELQENKHFLQQITDHSAQILYILNPITWVNLYTNRQTLDILGYTPEEFQQGGAQFFQEIIHPDDVSLIFSNMDFWKTAEDGEVLTTEYRMRHKNGDWIWLRSRDVIFARDENNQVIKILGTAQDISDRKKIEMALAEAKETAEAATKAKSEFLANMSHELRTPMNGVIGMTQILATTNLSKQQQDYLKTIRDSGDALLSVINDILDFSKIESGMLDVEASEFELEEVVKTACNLLNNQAIDKHIYLQYKIDPDIPTMLIGDRTRLRQVLLNLISNAIKFTEYGQVSVSVSGELKPHTQQSPDLERAENYELKFTVSDTGIGIYADRIVKLFQPFTQADTSISRRYGGTGLGLTISKRLVELMGGTIWVESFGQVGGNPPLDWKLTAKTQGSKFYFTIAVSTMATAEKTQESSEQTSSLKLIIDPQTAAKFPLNILLVEDNKVNQMVAKLMMQQLGYQVDVANNGIEAVKAVETQSYDLILMDIQMPEMDGLTATKLIRKKLIDKKLIDQTQIMAMTADVLPEERQACIDAGMNDFIGKPIDIQQIIQLVTSVKPYKTIN